MALTDRPDAPAQPNLFDVDDPALDAPVPFMLTARGRRVVDVDGPHLRVVGGGATGEGSPRGRVRADDVGDGAGHEGDPRIADEQVVADLDHTDTWRHARVRAMARAGTGLDEIADDLGISPTVVRVWLAGPGVPPGVRTDDAAPSTDPSPDPSPNQAPDRVAPPSDGGGDPAAALSDAQALAVLATCGVVEVGAVVATTTRIAVAEVVVAWLRARHDVTPGQVRVVLQVADRATSDLVARAWADRLGLTPDRVNAVAWSRAPSPRAVQATVRVSGRDLAGRVGAQLDAWPVRP